MTNTLFDQTLEMIGVIRILRRCEQFSYLLTTEPVTFSVGWENIYILGDQHRDLNDALCDNFDIPWPDTRLLYIICFSNNASIVIVAYQYYIHIIYLYIYTNIFLDI